MLIFEILDSSVLVLLVSIFRVLVLKLLVPKVLVSVILRLSKLGYTFAILLNFKNMRYSIVNLNRDEIIVIILILDIILASIYCSRLESGSCWIDLSRSRLIEKI